MPSLSTKNETKRKAHELKRAGLSPRKEPPKDMKHIQKEPTNQTSKPKQ